MKDDEDALLRKATECLDGAESEYINKRYNNCANRCYYACYQAAVMALTREGVGPGGGGTWSHKAVQSQFVGQLINRRKVYSGDLRETLSLASILRQTADYRQDDVSEIQAIRALRRAKAFVEAVQRTKGGQG